MDRLVAAEPMDEAEAGHPARILVLASPSALAAALIEAETLIGAGQGQIRLVVICPLPRLLFSFALVGGFDPRRLEINALDHLETAIRSAVMAVPPQIGITYSLLADTDWHPIRRMIDEHCYDMAILSSVPFPYIWRKLERHLQQNGKRPLPIRV